MVMRAVRDAPAGEGLLLILTPLYAVAAADCYGRPTAVDAV